VRLSPKGDTEVWYRQLQGGAVAVGLFNKNGGSGPAGLCNPWNVTTGGYIEACGGPAGEIGCFAGISLEEALDTCCNNSQCASFSFRPTDGSGCYKFNTDCGKNIKADFDGYAKFNFKPSPGQSASITVNFQDIGLPDKVHFVYAYLPFMLNMLMIVKKKNVSYRACR
jgi:hypothetical protein